MAKAQQKTFRLNIPLDDPRAIEWCQNQRHYLSLAIRILIQREIASNGTGNIFATQNDIVMSTRNVRVKSKRPSANNAASNFVKNPDPADPDQDAQDSEDLKNMMM